MGGTPCSRVLNKNGQRTYSFTVRNRLPCAGCLKKNSNSLTVGTRPLKEISVTVDTTPPCSCPGGLNKKAQYPSFNTRKSPPSPCPELLHKREHSFTVGKSPCLEDLNKKVQCSSFNLCKSPEYYKKKKNNLTLGNSPPSTSPGLLINKKKYVNIGKCPSAPCKEELIKKEQYLNHLAKELIQLQKKLEQQQSRLNKKFDTKAKADLKAAKKLNQARKQLQLTVSTTSKGGHRKTEKQKSFSVDNLMDTQWKWLDKIHSVFKKLHENVYSYFFKRRQGFSESCALYVKKMKGASRPSEVVCPRCSRGTHLDYSFCMPFAYRRRVQSPAGDCHGMATGPTFWSNRRPTQPCSMLCGSMQYCCALIAGFIFWLPCLLCLALLCSCYSCCCYEC